MKVRWLRAATLSLRLIHGWIATDNPQVARRVAERIRSAVIRLATFPSSGREGQVPGTRELIVPDLPYVVVYRVTGREIEILRVFHAARDWPPLMQ